jgi:hypothetical protein
MEEVGGGEGADLDEFAWEKGGLLGNGWSCGGEDGGGCGEFGLEEIAELGEGGVHGVKYCSIEQFNAKIQSCKRCCGVGAGRGCQWQRCAVVPVIHRWTKGVWAFRNEVHEIPTCFVCCFGSVCCGRCVFLAGG